MFYAAVNRQKVVEKACLNISNIHSVNWLDNFYMEFGWLVQFMYITFLIIAKRVFLCHDSVKTDFKPVKMYIIVKRIISNNSDKIIRKKK